MVLTARHSVHCGPAVFTIVLQTHDTSTIEWSRFPIALDTITLIAHLAIQDIGLYLDLKTSIKVSGTIVLQYTQHNEHNEVM